MEAQQQITVSVSDLKKIHNVACSLWKMKLERTVKPFEDVVVLTESQIDEMFDASNPYQLEVIESVFGKRIKNKLFDFSEQFTITQGVYESPIHIRHGFATDGNGNKEIGFSDMYTPVIVIDGKETELKTGKYGAYLKFKIK